VNSVAVLDVGEQEALFRQTAARKRILPVIAEKDFWVCWTLHRIFAIEDIPRLVFKGGTSLSKAYSVIERFSEDIDVTIVHDDLDIPARVDPCSEGLSNKKRKGAVDAIVNASTVFIQEQLLPLIQQDFSILDEREWRAWILEGDNEDGQTIMFQYPPALELEDYSASPYSPPIVRIEFGARGGSEPASLASIQPYAADYFPDFFSAPSTEISTLAAERTFWEKATFLHSENRRTPPPTGKQWLEKSRHCYDIVMLARKGIAESAQEDRSVLKAVADSKTIFWRRGWDDYQEAVTGGLRLVPRGPFGDALARDYPRMQHMIFGEAPSWEEITGELARLEAEINDI